MKKNLFKITNTDILIKLQSGKFADWEYLYDSFSPIMYGAILQITDSKEMANKILLEAFVCLKTKSFTGNSLIAGLLAFTKTVAINYMAVNKSSTVIQDIVDLIVPSNKFCNLSGVYRIQYSIEGIV